MSEMPNDVQSQAITVIAAKRPRGVDDAKEITLRQDAEVISTEIGGAADEFQVSNIMRKFGHSAITKMEEVNRRVGAGTQSLLSSFEGEESPVASKLLELRSVMEELNPHSLTNSWWFRYLPLGAKVRRHIVRRFAGRWQSEQTNVTTILDGLRSGKDQLLEQTIGMHQQFQDLDSGQLEVKKWIYVGELVWERLSALKVAETDQTEIKMLDSKLDRVARRIRDLRTMEQANNQFALTITQALRTNNLLDEQVQSALMIGPSVLQNGLRIHKALSTQRRVAHALKEFQGTLGTMMVENAKALETQAVEIGDLYNNPVIALDKLEESHTSLMNTIGTVENTIRMGTTQAREVSAKLAELSRAMEPEVKAQYGALDQPEAAALLPAAS